MGDEVSSYLKILHFSFVCAFIHIDIMFLPFLFLSQTSWMLIFFMSILLSNMLMQ